VPRAETVNSEGKQYFSRDRFTYDAGSDTWQCPAGETLGCHEVSHTEQKKKVHRLRRLRLEAALHRGGQAYGRASFLRGRPPSHAPAGHE
jgi:hypothetical protein